MLRNTFLALLALICLIPLVSCGEDAASEPKQSNEELLLEYNTQLDVPVDFILTYPQTDRELTRFSISSQFIRPVTLGAIEKVKANNFTPASRIYLRAILLNGKIVKPIEAYDEIIEAQLSITLHANHDKYDHYMKSDYDYLYNPDAKKKPTGIEMYGLEELRDEADSHKRIYYLARDSDFEWLFFDCRGVSKNYVDYEFGNGACFAKFRIDENIAISLGFPHVLLSEWRSIAKEVANTVKGWEK